MAATIAEAETVSPYSEMMAYEYIYAKEGTSRSHVSKILGTGGGLPTKAIATVDGLLPDETRHTEVRDYVDARIGGFSVLVDGTPQFPTRLRAERNPLPVFYYRGDISLLDSRCVSVVGTRHPSECGELAARRVARALVGEGITVVIGLAAGIDTAAAREALDAGGRVIGVMDGGHGHEARVPWAEGGSRARAPIHDAGRPSL